MTRFFAGIDGGQTSTTALVGDETGCVLGRGQAGAADEVGVGSESTRLRDALRDALWGACTDAGLSSGVRFETIVAGVSGYEGRVYGKAPELPAAHLSLVHDAVIAHAGALAGESGVVAIAGTGSVVYATGEMLRLTTGGWGYLFGDEGSAFGIVREALATLMRREDDQRAPASDETRAACEFFGLPSLRHIARAFYAGELTRDRLAAFAPTVLRFASFREIADRGADRLVALVASVIQAGATPTVACVGGVFGDARFKERVAAGVQAAVPAARVIDARYEPSTGALLLAYRAAGI